MKKEKSTSPLRSADAAEAGKEPHAKKRLSHKKPPRETQRRKTSIALPLDEAIRRDQLFLNNPVLIQGLALTPVVAAATSLKNAVVLSVVAILLITPVRLLGDLLYERVPVRLRAMTYAIFAAILFIPAAIIVQSMYGIDAYGPGMFVPLLAIDRIVLVRSEINSREGTPNAIRNGLTTSFGLSFVLLLCGALREFLGEGRLLGYQILTSGGILGVMSTAAGGFILVALLSALMQAIVSAYRKARTGGAVSHD